MRSLPAIAAWLALATTLSAANRFDLASATPSELRGRQLADVLVDARQQGLPLVFSTRVVTRDLRVDAGQLNLGASERRDLLSTVRALLLPHGLLVDRGAGDTWVVRPRAAEASTTGLVLEVLSLHSSEPVVSAVVRVDGGDAIVLDGRASARIHHLAAGGHTLLVAAADFETRRVDFELAPGATRRLTVRLQPLPYVADEIVVQASEITLLQEDPSTPSSIGREEIASLPQLGGDLYRALSQLPGVAAGDLTAKPSVRGSRQDELLTRLDGQELYEAFHLQDFDSALSLVPGGVLETASLQTGGAGVGFGDRTAGVLDLTTRQPYRLEARLSLSLLSAEAQAGATSPLEAARPLSWFASARRGSIDLANRLFGREEPEFWDIFGKLQAQVNDRQTLAFRLLRGDDRLRFSEQVDGESKEISTGYSSEYLWATHLAGVGPSTWVETSASRVRIERDRHGLEDEEEQRFLVDDRRDREILEVRQHWTVDRGVEHERSWRFGGQLRDLEARFAVRSDVEREFVLFSDEVLLAPRVTEVDGQIAGAHQALWLSRRFGRGDWSTEIGLRADRHDATGDEFLSPRLSLAWSPTGNQVVRASWGVFHQSQRPGELQVENGETTLQPTERSSQWSLGWEGSFAPGLRLVRLEAYGRQFDNPRPRFENLFEPFNVFREVEPDRFLLDADRARAHGLELTLRGEFGARHRWWVNTALQRSEDRLRENGRSRWISRENEQRETLNLGWSTRLGGHWTLDVVGRLHGGWPTTPIAAFEPPPEEEEDDGPEEGDDELSGPTAGLQNKHQRLDDIELARIVLGAVRSERLDTYSRIDLRLARRWEKPRATWRLFFDVQNLLDQRNVSGFDLAVDDDELVVDRERWPGTFFSAGVSWSF